MRGSLQVEVSLDLCAQVRIVGNQRTRAGVVGQVGIVKRAVGLGERVRN